MAGMPGPLARGAFEAFQQHQAELERRRAAGIEPDHFVGRPGLAESMIPVWGSGREAIADFQEGDYVGAGINGLAAASDLFLAGAAGKGAVKLVAGAGARYAAKHDLAKRSPEVLAAGVRQLQKDAALLSKPTRGGKPPWNYERVQPRMKRYGMVKEGEELHHWAFPQAGRGKAVPNFVENNPLSLHAMPKQAHQLTHGNLPSQGLQKYGPVERYWAGTPAWAKAAPAGTAAHAAGAVKRPLDERR